jgi:chromosome segregation ATPase
MTTQCPKCGSANILDVWCYTLLAGNNPTNKDCWHCSKCDIRFTSWQQVEIERLNRLINDDTARCFAVCTKINDKEQENIPLRSEIERLKREVERLASDIAGYSNQLLESQVACEKMDSVIKRLQGEELFCEGEIERLNADLEKTEGLLSRANNMVADARIERNHLRALLTEIAEHEHCNSGCRHTGMFNELELSTEVNRGTAKGHRCAAEIARKGLSDSRCQGSDKNG